MTVREAAPGDAAAVAPLLGELGYPADAGTAARRLERLAADPRSRVLVAERDGAVVGLVATHLIPRVNGDRPACKLIASAFQKRLAR